MKTNVQIVEKYRELIFAAERYIWNHPETGFKEYQTSAYMAEQFEKLGYQLTYAEGITGFYTEVNTGKAGPTVLVLAELDAVVCPSHPAANPQTGAVHACGHNAQCAAILGLAAALKEQDVLQGLCGKIRLCCVPAEECLEFDYRKELQRKGKIGYLGGKTEFLSRGYFDGVDMAFMVHTGASKERGGSVNVGGDTGFIAKTITYKGVTGHASCGAWLAKNALYAAMSGLNAVNALRETFKENDKVRWHPIIVNGGDVVNNIPDKVVVESQLRGANYEVLQYENRKINRALAGAALSFGAQIEIDDDFGYAPLQNSADLAMLAKEAFDSINPVRPCSVYGQGGQIGGGSTDLGDLSALMPVIHPYIGGAAGKGHGEDWEIFDPEHACVTSAKWQLAIIRKLLEDNATRAREILANYHAPFATKEEFFACRNMMRRNGECIQYDGENRAEIIL